MSQCNFFMLPKDERAFFAMLKERGDTSFVKGRFHPKPRPAIVTSLAAAGPEVVLVNPAFGAPPVLTERGAGEFKGLYMFDMYKDPHIDWSRSRRSRGARALLPGRVFAKIGWAKPHDNDLFRRWYDGIVSLIKKSSVAGPGSAKSWRIFPEAAAWWKQGNFCFGDENALRAGPNLKHVPR